MTSKEVSRGVGPHGVSLPLVPFLGMDRVRPRQAKGGAAEAAPDNQPKDKRRTNSLYLVLLHLTDEFSSTSAIIDAFGGNKKIVWGRLNRLVGLGFAERKGGRNTPTFWKITKEGLAERFRIKEGSKK